MAKPALVNRFPRVLADAYGKELADEARAMHEAVMALIRALKNAWQIRYGEAVVEVSLSDIVQDIRDTVAEFFDDSWVVKLAKRFTGAALKAALRNLQIELRRALGSRYPGEVYIPPGRLGVIEESRVMAQVQEIKSIPEKYVVAVTRLIADSAANGIPYHDLEGALEELVDITESRAHMIAVTELNRAYSEMAFDRYDALGVEHVIWITADDERTCEECAPLDGQRMTVDQAHDMLPKHPNCRCSIIADPDELRESGV